MGTEILNESETEAMTDMVPHTDNHECVGCAADIRAIREQLNEVHQFVSALAHALNSPMVKSILPPHVRAMLGD